MKEIDIKQDMFPEINALSVTSAVTDLVNYLPEHKDMLVQIQQSLPEIQRASSLFNKSQSQFMDNMLTVSHPTPIRNLRQILAEMNKTREALKESHFGCKKKEIEIQMKERDLSNETDELKSALIKVEIMELYSQLESTKGYISGAIRKLTNYTEQYNSIISSMGVSNFNEIDFEAEEERYHIMKAFDQGLIAARSRSGIVDEGNLIYFSQIGINGSSAQKDIRDLLIIEGKLLHEGKEPSYELVLEFLNKMAIKYKGCSVKYAQHKGMTGKITEKAALKSGDARLLKGE